MSMAGMPGRPAHVGHSTLPIFYFCEAVALSMAAMRGR
jgi:hypothetical protein